MTDEPLSKPKMHIPSSEREDTLELLCTLYDLYDAQRWIRRFLLKNKDKEFESLMSHLEQASFALSEMIKEKSVAMDRIMEEKSKSYKSVKTFDAVLTKK